MPRFRVAVDVITDVPLTSYQIERIQSNANTLVRGAAAADVDGVDIDLKVEPVYSMHNHESTDAYACQYCRHAAQDGYNSDN